MVEQVNGGFVINGSTLPSFHHYNLVLEAENNRLEICYSYVLVKALKQIKLPVVLGPQDIPHQRGAWPEFSLGT